MLVDGGIFSKGASTGVVAEGDALVGVGSVFVVLSGIFGEESKAGNTNRGLRAVGKAVGVVTVGRGVYCGVVGKES